jgi:cobalt/nickel transport system permease protein
MRPEILESSGAGVSLPQAISVKKVLIALGLATLVVGGVLSIFASAYPDGLEWSMEGVAGTAELEAGGPAFRQAEAIQGATAFMPDYGFPLDDEGSAAGTAVAGIVGSVLTCALAGLVGFVIWRVKKSRVKPA